jgi:hypothetical protein
MNTFAVVNVCLEGEEDLTVRPRQVPGRLAGPDSGAATPPTLDALAGIYVYVEAEEDLTVRPHSPNGQRVAGVERNETPG